jgi:hypothetical protein
LGAFAEIDVIAFARAPHDYVEALYKEWVAAALPAGARSIEEMLVDHGDNLTDFPALFAPFEQQTGRPVRLADFDALRAAGDVWGGFCALAGLPETLTTCDLPRYPTPDRDSIRLMQLLNMTVSDRHKRQRMMDTYFAACPAPATGASLLPPDRRLAIASGFEAQSGEFAASRGFSFDISALKDTLEAQDWSPCTAISTDHLDALLDVGAQVAAQSPLLSTAQPDPSVKPAAPQAKAKRAKGPSLTIRPRPWVMALFKAVTRATGRGRN